MVHYDCEPVLTFVIIDFPEQPKFNTHKAQNVMMTEKDMPHAYHVCHEEQRFHQDQKELHQLRKAEKIYYK